MRGIVAYKPEIRIDLCHRKISVRIDVVNEELVFPAEIVVGADNSLVHCQIAPR